MTRTLLGNERAALLDTVRPAEGGAIDRVSLEVAGLGVSLDLESIDLRLRIPLCHRAFVTDRPSGENLTLSVRRGVSLHGPHWRPILHRMDTWELWRDDRERWVFSTTPYSPSHWSLTVDAAFSSGELVGEPDATETRGTYPLAGLDIVLYANRLACHGDLILHAAGVAIDGKGYCFLGASGAGKSTVAAALARRPGVTVLGEDQVILRYREDRFWIFGTPWHLSPLRCSPVGVPLDKLIFLDRSIEPGLIRCDALEGVTRTLQTAFVPYYRHDALPAILERLDLLSECVPLYRFCHQLGTNPIPILTGE